MDNSIINWDQRINRLGCSLDVYSLIQRERQIVVYCHGEKQRSLPFSRLGGECLNPIEFLIILREQISTHASLNFINKSTWLGTETLMYQTLSVGKGSICREVEERNIGKWLHLSINYYKGKKSLNRSGNNKIWSMIPKTHLELYQRDNLCSCIGKRSYWWIWVSKGLRLGCQVNNCLIQSPLNPLMQYSLAS